LKTGNVLVETNPNNSNYSINLYNTLCLKINVLNLFLFLNVTSNISLSNDLGLIWDIHEEIGNTEIHNVLMIFSMHVGNVTFIL